MKVFVKETCTLVAGPSSIVEVTNQQLPLLGDKVEIYEEVSLFDEQKAVKKTSKIKKG